MEALSRQNFQHKTSNYREKEVDQRKIVLLISSIKTLILGYKNQV